jgi:hypothetical protein
MKTIQNIYEPYDFTKNPCYIIGVAVNQPGYVKIEYKIPDFLKNLTGVFASVTCRNSSLKLAGFLILNFNQQLTKCFQLPIFRTNLYPKKDHSKPVELNEEIVPNSYVQGFFYDYVGLGGEYPYTLKIYLHYKVHREN